MARNPHRSVNYRHSSVNSDMLPMVRYCILRLCVKAVTEPDSAESTENTERPGPNLRKIANKYDLLLPVSSGTGSIWKVC